MFYMTYCICESVFVLLVLIIYYLVSLTGLLRESNEDLKMQVIRIWINPLELTSQNQQISWFSQHFKNIFLANFLLPKKFKLTPHKKAADPVFHDYITIEIFTYV